MEKNTAMIFAADIFYHNIATLNGQNSFHGKGMIAAITPEINFEQVIHRKQITDKDIKTV
jgi:hypothetical protein